MREYEDLGALLAEGGAIVGGGAALCGTVLFVVASLVRDLGYRSVDPLWWAERGARAGGVMGLAAWAFRIAGLD
jgi:hypothetical protein